MMFEIVEPEPRIKRTKKAMAEARRAGEVLLANGFDRGVVRSLLGLAEIRGGGHRKASEARTERMRALYAEGRTLEQIGGEFGITRERVRQLIQMNHNHGGASVRAEAKRQAFLQQTKTRRNEKAVELFGCDYETAFLLNGNRHPAYNNGTYASEYLDQKKTMQMPGRQIQYELTFAQWLEAWGGKITFKQRGKWGLVRKDPEKGFIVGNVEVAEIPAKASETMRRTHEKMKRIRALQAKGLSQAEIAERLGLSRPYLDQLAMFARKADPA